MAIEKMEPGADTSVRVIEKLNELIDAVNGAFIDHRPYDRYRAWQIIWGGREHTKEGSDD